MTDSNELELDLELGEENENINNRANERITNLSSKVKETAKERDTERQLREDAEAKVVAAEKKAEFLEGFAGVSTKYPNAAEFKDAIQEKVLTNGYSVEDATLSVLNAEGKLTAPVQEFAPAAGGSAVNPSLQGAEKPYNEMTREEKRAQLEEAEKSGELAQILARGL